MFNSYVELPEGNTFWYFDVIIVIIENHEKNNMLEIININGHHG